MLFNSLTFVLCFPVFCLLYFTVPGRWQQPLLVLASLGACAVAGFTTFAWLLGITATGFLFGRRLGRPHGPWLLVLALVSVALPLVVLKYANFTLESLQTFLGWVGVRWAATRLDFAQPAGLSFYTFVVLGYLIDVHIERDPPETRLGRFTLFTAFFPKLVSGPIERAGGFLPQLETPKRFDYDRVTDGGRIMAWGYFRKLVVADRLATIVDPAFKSEANLRGVTLAFVCILYMFQVYYDFWAYSDIAVGAARVLGFDLTWNFNRPYAATSVSDYWRRWHISLTRWFFDYIFTPLAAVCRAWGVLGVVLPLMVTLIVSGLWHGAQWTFVLFGVFHGVAMGLEHATNRWRKRIRAQVPGRLYRAWAWASTFTFLLCVDVFFRARTAGEAFGILRRLFGGLGPDLVFVVKQHSVPAVKALMAGIAAEKIEVVIAVIALVLVELTSRWGQERPVRERLAGQPAWVRWGVYYAVAGAILFLGAHNQTTEFLYVQF